jgi:inorganic pyrophosphatase
MNIYIYNIYTMYNVDMIVEIPYNSNIKYEYDKNMDKIRVDRILNTSMLYPGNYGYIPNTLSGDGDPLDVLLITDYPILPGSIVDVRIIGVLYTVDEKGEDEKIIAVPTNDVDSSYENISSLNDLSPITLKKIKHFFTHYKDNDKNKWVEVKAFSGAPTAFNKYLKSRL